MGSHGTGQFGVVNRSTCIDSKYRSQRQQLSLRDLAPNGPTIGGSSRIAVQRPVGGGSDQRDAGVDCPDHTCVEPSPEAVGA
jgi:hypothetical protein